MNKTCSFKDDNVFISVTITSFEKKIKIKSKAELPPPLHPCEILLLNMYLDLLIINTCDTYIPIRIVSKWTL